MEETGRALVLVGAGRAYEVPGRASERTGRAVEPAGRPEREEIGKKMECYLICGGTQVIVPVLSKIIIKTMFKVRLIRPC